MVRIQNMRPLAFKLIPWEFFEKLIILSKMDENIFVEKCVLKLCLTAMIKPRQIEPSGFFLLDSNLQTGFSSIRCLVVEKSRFSDRGWWFRKVCPQFFSDRHNWTEANIVRFNFSGKIYCSPYFGGMDVKRKKSAIFSGPYVV